MGQPVEQGASKALVAEGGGPFVEGQVRSDDGGDTAIALKHAIVGMHRSPARSEPLRTTGPDALIGEIGEGPALADRAKMFRPFDRRHAVWRPELFSGLAVVPLPWDAGHVLHTSGHVGKVMLAIGFPELAVRGGREIL